ncbi:hypothetical protein J7L36_00745 [bacterium]|nr:hypothetical protein [bacterium]
MKGSSLILADLSIGGAIIYTFMGLTGWGPYVLKPLPPLDALIGLVVGMIAGLSYAFLGLPVLLLERIEIFQKWSHEFFKSIIRCEVAIISAIVILIGFYTIVGPPIGKQFLFLEVSVIFSLFALIGPAVRESFKKALYYLIKH